MYVETAHFIYQTKVSVTKKSRSSTKKQIRIET